jgi:hypothetical protein
VLRADLQADADEPFRIYARGKRRPFDLGRVMALSAEALRDLCNHSYRHPAGPRPRHARVLERRGARGSSAQIRGASFT